MCDPVSIASTAAAGVGSLISGNEANASARAQSEARNAATLAEVERSKVYGAKSRNEFDASMGLYAPGAQEASRAAATSDIGATLAGNAPTAESVGTLTTASAPRVVAEAEKATLGDVFKRNATNNSNMATLKGYDQNAFDTNLGVNQQGRNIDQIGDFAKVSSGVNQIEQRAAFNNAKKPSSGIGELLSFAGTLGANAGGRGSIKIPGFSGSMAAPGFNPMTSAGAIY